GGGRGGPGARPPDPAEVRSAGALRPATSFWFLASEKLPRRYGPGERTPAPADPPPGCTRDSTMGLPRRRSGATGRPPQWWLRSWGLGGEVYEGVAAEGGIDFGFHAVDGGSALALEAEGEVGVGVGGAHEAPAVGEEDAHAVDVDALVAALEIGGELADDGELLVVGAGRLELRGRMEVGQPVEVGGDGPGVPGDQLENLARGEDAVVHGVPVLAEEHVPRDLAPEQDAVLAHLALQVGMPRLPHHGLATMGEH